MSGNVPMVANRTAAALRLVRRHQRRSAVSRPLSILLLAVALVLLVPASVNGQYLTRPNVPWRSITTEHFDIHFPAEMQQWTEAIAVRIESMAAAVNAMVGNEPRSRITVMVEDPSNVSNGFALPFLDGPVMFLWPTPPSPSPSFGTHRGWGEILAVHEYGHVAHLTFPSRNPRERLLWKLLPVQLSPVLRKAPPWVIEGYATVIEGRLTGSGRPSSVGRAAVMRQWALEGKFPTYAQLRSSGTYLGGNMRYLVGSAFLEWLLDRKGDSSLVHLWRRMSARQERSFGAAFAGVFGALPQDLYGAFLVDITAKSLDIRSRIGGAGLVEGELVQRLSGGTGDPAFSPDGQRIAVVVRQLNGPSRLVIWAAEVPEADTTLLRARARIVERDPLDVVPFDSFPRPRRALASLHPAGGRSHEHPRWMPDGVQVLVTRDEPAADGVTRPDLFLWDTRSQRVRRVTHNAGVRQADPAPDGLNAAAVRCHAGICDLVVVNLRNGEARVLAPGSLDVVWHRPRWSPDGGSVAASYQAGGTWNVAVIDARSGTVRRIGSPDGTSRHSPAWTASGGEVVVVSERGGVANLELFPIDGSAPAALTRVTGAVMGPEVNRADGSVAFLSMRSGGLDLRRLRTTAPGAAVDIVRLGAVQAPAAPATMTPGMRFAEQQPTTARDYGLGPRRWRVLPGGLYGPDGSTASLMVANIDPISRLSVVAQGGIGTKGAWRGGSLSVALRRLAVAIDASAWYVDHAPSERRSGRLAPFTADLRYRGAGVVARVGREAGLAGYLLRAGVTAGTVDGLDLDHAERIVALGDARGRLTLGLGRNTVHLTGNVLVNAGSTGGESFTRVTHGATVTIGTSRRSLRGEWRRGRTDVAGPGQPGRALEEFLVGGPTPPWFDAAFLSNRIALPSVPSGFLFGHQFELYRASIGGRGWEPYFIWVAAGDALRDPKRIAGLEQSVAIESIGWVRLPAVRARVGAGYSFDAPFAYRTRAYVSVSYSP